MYKISTEKFGKIELDFDPEVYPETTRYLEELVKKEASPFQVAIDLMDCDRGEVMPKCLFDFIVTLLEDAIKTGNHYAMNDLGALYYDGRGYCQDFEKAVYYYKMAAKHGNAQAMENLGYCYYYGRSVPVDYEEAFRCFSFGAFDGMLISLYKIGDMYRNGYYVEKNLEKAFRIYSRCIKLMTDDDAEFIAGPVFLRLGNAYFYGEGIEKNFRNALRFYQHAEIHLYDMVEKGDVMYKGSLLAAIEGQKKARKKLIKDLPERTF